MPMREAYHVVDMNLKTSNVYSRDATKLEDFI